MERIKVGVIGCGYWGPKLARNFYELQEAQLEWVADLDMARLNHIKSLYPDVQTTQDVSEVYASDVDAIVIATPVNTHYQLAMDSLQAGKHILVEKPMTACVDQAQEIIAKGEQQDRVVMVGHTFVYNPAVEAIREIIADGQLGEIYYINGVRVNLGLFQPDINVAWDLAPHDISILSYVLDKEPVSVSAHGGVYVQREKGIHDVAYICLYYPNGVFAEIRSSWLDPIKVRQYTIVGSEKMLVYDDIEQVNKIVIHDKGVDSPPFSDTEEEFHFSYHSDEGIPYPINWTEPLRVECQHFLDCINEGEEPRSSGKDGFQMVRVLESIQYSLINGGIREVIGDNRGFCAHRTRRETGPRCQDLCLRQPVWLRDRG
jgi:predicted dehydrogenase